MATPSEVRRSLRNVAADIDPDYIHTLYLKLYDFADGIDHPWSVAAFNARAGMVRWLAGEGAWVEDGYFLAPHFIYAESGSWPISAEECAVLVAQGVGPPSAFKELRRITPEEARGLPTAPPRPRPPA